MNENSHIRHSALAPLTNRQARQTHCYVAHTNARCIDAVAGVRVQKIRSLQCTEQSRGVLLRFGICICGDDVLIFFESGFAKKEWTFDDLNSGFQVKQNSKVTLAST